MNHSAPIELLDALARHAAETPRKVALREVGGKTLNYAQLYERVCSLAGHLQQNVDRGTTVLLCCPNTPDFHVAFLAILSAGCHVFPFSPDAVIPELITAIEKS